MKKIITYGTFDLFHQGHYNILKRARALGDYLIVGVTSESFDIERGKLNVQDNLLTRIENVRKTGFADEIIVEEYQGQKLNDILHYGIDTLVLGSDWYGKFDYLENYCHVVYLERTKNISSTQLRNERDKIYCIGIVTDDLDDGGMTEEAKYVSGIHVRDVYSENISLANDFAKKYPMAASYDDWDAFLEGNDIIYVKCASDRADYCRRALEAGKYVICEAPVTSSSDELRGLFELATAKGRFLLEKIPMVYLRAFNQLVWLLQGGLIGDVAAIQCAVRDDDKHRPRSDMMIYPICAAVKILGQKYSGLTNHCVRDGDRVIYRAVTMNYPSAVAVLEAGSGVAIENRMNIIGREGRVVLDGEWWNTGYFEARFLNQKGTKHYSFNFEGNGFRYLLHEMMIMIKDGRIECTRLFHSESIRMLEILELIDSGKQMLETPNA